MGYGELLAHWPRVAELLHRFRLAHPDVPVMATETPRPEMRAGLRDNRLDVGIIGMIQWPPRGFDGLRLFPATQTGVILAAEHPLARKSSIRFPDLKGLRWFHLRPDATWDAFACMRDRLMRQGFPVTDRTVRPAGYAYLPQIAAGEGWSLADESLAHAVAGIAPSIVYRPLEGELPQLWVVAIWKKGSSSPEVRSFAKIAEKTFANGR